MKQIFAIITLIIILGINSINANAQSTAITGQIVDTENYSPVTSASITLNSTSDLFVRSIMTNDNGLFELDGVPAGSYRMTVSYNGYRKATYNVSVKDGIIDMGIIELNQDRRFAENTNGSKEN